MEHNHDGDQVPEEVVNEVNVEAVDYDKTAKVLDEAFGADVIRAATTMCRRAQTRLGQVEKARGFLNRSSSPGKGGKPIGENRRRRPREILEHFQSVPSVTTGKTSRMRNMCRGPKCIVEVQTVDRTAHRADDEPRTKTT